MFVKICGVTTVDDALLAAGLGADSVGLNFANESPRRINRELARDIVRRLPPEIVTVGVFRNQARDYVVETANKLGLRAVQLHGHETPEDSRWIAARVPAVIRAFSYADPALSSGADYGPHRLLIDSPTPGSGQVFDWSNLEIAAAGRKFILAGGLGPDNVADAIGVARPWGVDTASGVESAPGRKDPSKVRRFIAAARQAAGALGPDHDPFELAATDLFPDDQVWHRLESGDRADLLSWTVGDQDLYPAEDDKW
ncbi:MAG: phosphoribosylanthranilate isomerase [Acidimicrobiia bacterium]|nr:phosphoribosylanthranilate isomerase [Acidimicrobiia bacterium]